VCGLEHAVYGYIITLFVIIYVHIYIIKIIENDTIFINEVLTNKEPAMLFYVFLG
jgi:hypothetical protein